MKKESDYPLPSSAESSSNQYATIAVNTYQSPSIDMAISISRNLLPHFHPFDRDGNIARRVTRSFRTCVEFPWQKTDSNPAPVAFRLIEELNNRNCFLRLCSRAIVEDTRAWPRKAWLLSRSRIKGSNCTRTPCFMCVYMHILSACMCRNRCAHHPFRWKWKPSTIICVQSFLARVSF